MKLELPVSGAALKIVSRLREAGFESYIVGGAVRDLLLDRQPKDFDISTSATPEEVRQVFGRRQCRIIGKRFRLTHVYMEQDIYEVSTFRSAPAENAGQPSEYTDKKHYVYGAKPENLILSDNSYGSAKEDAWRRDFTVNALFYDPITKEVLDLTGMGLADIETHTVRAIGNPALRFEEDPVRMLRALKLVAQFDFTLDNATENALFASLSLLRHAAASRLTLELEKILQSTYCDRHFEVFHDYGLLPYFLPEMSRVWGMPEQKKMLSLLYERNCRVDEGIYRNSVSLAIAAAAQPFVESAMANPPGALLKKHSGNLHEVISDTIERLFAPLTLMVRMREAACRILKMQRCFDDGAVCRRGELMNQRSYPHARELLVIRHTVENSSQLREISANWPAVEEKRRKQQEFDRQVGRGKRGGKKSYKNNKRNDKRDA